MRLSHIGIAVQNIEERLVVWHDLLGLEVIARQEVTDQKVKIAILDVNGIHVELLEPLSEDSAVARFIKKKGEGIHHLCFAVENIEESLKRFKDRNLRLIDEVPREGASGKKIAFINPQDLGGVLIELTEG
jgi:methylmalonyl-CoA/ethylmalonyl-CoA epimerase